MTDANKARLQQALQLLLQAGLTLLTTSGLGWEAALLQLGGGLSKLITAADVTWVLDELAKAGKLSEIEAAAAWAWLRAHAPDAEHATDWPDSYSYPRFPATDLPIQYPSKPPSDIP